MVNKSDNKNKVVYYQHSTSNKSFINMHLYLKDKGIKNNEFMLLILDPGLVKFNPFDPKLPSVIKSRILRECIYNPWYFLREICRIPSDGNANGDKFRLDRGNMAMIFCLMLNLNTYVILPRQTGKTQSALAWYLYLFNFGTNNAEMSFLNKKFDDSKLNLNRIKAIRDLLPSYLKMDHIFSNDGNKLKGKNSVEKLEHPINGNRIITVPSARDKSSATSLMRGRTTSIIHIDELAFIKHNKIIYLNMIPAWNTAAKNAKRNNKPYGILITTTPGLLTTDEGEYAYSVRENATKFSENWYDLSYNEIMDIIDSNGNSNFVHIEYTYQQLGYSEQWFKNLCIEMGKSWSDIRREILLEWSTTNENSPFNKEDLDSIRALIKVPINSFMIFNKYTINVYEKINQKYPPIIGADVSGGYQRDSSALTIIDSHSTRVAAEFNCNYISTKDFASLIYEIVTKYLPNAVVNIERNGGFGSSVIPILMATSIKKNLFYTIKDKVIEERIDGAHITKKTQKTKIFGSDSTHGEREKLMDILRNRVEYHKDKIISKTIYDELCGLEVKKNGRIEHSANTHDDQVFSWLWALYVYYEGIDLVNNWGIKRTVLKTDADLEEAVFDIKEEQNDITEQLTEQNNQELIDSQLAILNSGAGNKTYSQFMAEQKKNDDIALQKILSTKNGKEAYAKLYNVPLDSDFLNPTMTTIPDNVFTDFNKDDSEIDQVDHGNLYNQYMMINTR